MGYRTTRRQLNREFREQERSRVDQGNAILKAQEAARAADPRPSEEIVREQRDEWERDPPSPSLAGSSASTGMNRGSA